MNGKNSRIKALTAGVPPSHLTLLLLRSITIGLFSPVMSLLLVEKGLSLATLPLVTGAFGVTVVLLEFPSGVCADTYGRRPTFLLSLIFRMGNLLLFAFGFGLPMMIVAGILNGASTAFSSGSIEALILEQTVNREGRDRLPSISRTITAVDTAGIALGALVGGAVPLLTGRYRTVTAVAALTLLLQALLCHFRVREDRPAQRESAGVLSCVRESSRFVVRNPLVFRLLIASVGIGILLFSVESYWQLTFLEAGAPGWALGPLSFGGFGSVLVGSFAISGALKKREHWWAAFVTSRLLMALAMALLLAQRTAAGFAGSYLVLYFFLGCSNIPENAILHAETPNALRASALSLLSLATRFGGVVFALISSAAVGALGIRGIWLAAAFSLAGITAVCALAKGGAGARQNVDL